MTQNRHFFIAAGIGLLPFIFLVTSHVPFLLSVLLYVCLWVLSLYDWFTFRLPNLLTAILALTGLLYIYSYVPDSQSDHLIGGVVGLLFFPILNFLYKMIRGRDGVGMGDAKLLAGIGLWLGWHALPLVLLIGSFGGLLYALLAQFSSSDALSTRKLPFGPFLSLGCWIVWLYY